MGDDQNQEGWINCSFHPGAKPTYSTPGESDVHGQGRTEEGIHEDQGNSKKNSRLHAKIIWRKINALVGKNDDLEKKIGVFVGNPVPKAEVDECTCPDNYIIIDDTDSEPSEDDFVDEAGADIMESSTDQNF